MYDIFSHILSTMAHSVFPRKKMLHTPNTHLLENEFGVVEFFLKFIRRNSCITFVRVCGAGGIALDFGRGSRGFEHVKGICELPIRVGGVWVRWTGGGTPGPKAPVTGRGTPHRPCFQRVLKSLA